MGAAAADRANAKPSTTATATEPPAPVDPGQLWRDYDVARDYYLAGEQEPPTRADMRPRTEKFRGRRLKVTRSASWGALDLFVNGELIGRADGSSAAAMDRAAAQLRSDVLGADERRVTEADAYPAYWFKGATELPAAIVAYVRYRAEQGERDRAAIAATSCTDPGHVPSVMGCPLPVADCNGVPVGTIAIHLHEVRDTAGMTGFDMAGLDFRNALAAQLPDVGALSSGETGWDHSRVRRAAVWQLPVSGRTVTVVHYNARTATGEGSYAAVLVDGALVAAGINAAQPSDALCRFLVWTGADAIRTAGPAPAPAETDADVPQDSGQDNGAGSAETAVSVDEAAPAVPTFRTWQELAEHIRPSRPSGVDEARADGRKPNDAPEPSPVRPELGDDVRVAGWSGVRAFVTAVQQDAVTGWDTDQTLRFPVGKVTEVIANTLSEMRHAAALILESPARTAKAGSSVCVEVVEPARAILATPTWVSGAPKPGEGVRVPAVNDTAGKRLENVELLAETVEKLGCGCWRIGCKQPGPLTAETMWKRRVNLLTGCSLHEAHATVSAPAAAEPGDAVETAMSEISAGLNAAVAAKSAPAPAAITAPTAGLDPRRTWKAQPWVTAHLTDAETIEAASSAVDEARADLREAVASCDTARIETAETVRDEAVNALADVLADKLPTGDPADSSTDQDEERPASWPEFYTLGVDDYAPVLPGDEPDEHGALITIRHDHESGTVIDGSDKGDGVYEIAKRHGFTFRPTVGIFIKGSRDRFAQLGLLEKLAAELRENGHRVAFDIDDVWRPAAVRAEARAERVSERVERLAARASRKHAEGNGRREAARSIGDLMPFGEPIKIGHHSERRHRRAFERIDANYRAAYAAYDYAEHLAGRAAGAESNEAAKRNPRAMMRRSETLATDVRKFEREIAELQASDSANRSRYRRRLLLEIERRREEIAFIAAQLGDKATSGEFVAWSKADFRKGDLANVRGRWCEVTRVNAKSVSVADRFGWGGTGTASWDEIFGRRRDGMQWDSPNGEPWPVADAAKGDRWAALVSRYQTCTSYDQSDADERRKRIHVAFARRIVLGLDVMASVQEVDAYGEPADKTGQRRRAVASLDVFNRLEAGEPVPAVAASVEPLNDSEPRWTMPAGEPTDVTVSDLRVGDIVAGVYDVGFGGSRPRLITSMVGPVTANPTVRDRHESGEWVGVEVDGDTHELRAFRRCSAHLLAAR